MADEHVTVEIQGLVEIEKKFEKMGDNLRRRGAREALKAGGNIFKNLLVAEAPVNKDPTGVAPAGFLKEHFNVLVRAKAESIEGGAFIGPQGKIDYPYYPSGSRNYKRDKKGNRKKVGRIAVASVARFLQFGTSKMAANPFMTRAFDRGISVVLETVRQKLEEFLINHP